ncbi:SDR family oxidoreductase [Xanthomonas sp. CFBP 8703]|uniref:SDR family oxidoreductase n=1 Tax=Xanthomonas bonasiae TaxID=2810351 RepID=A0ABS3B2D9_9XANT|nr:SDR family oxidoreductase [Xanthomonas bonasiae]MBN6102480.1 SDR family oxidoreductase [Xanthomonas bonasiae]
MDLRGRSVVLTGASGGIGAALCDELVAAGTRVLAVGRDPLRLAQVASRHPQGQVLALPADLCNDSGRAQLLAAARALQAPPSLLLIAHAQSGFGLFAEQSEQELRRMLETNLLAPMLLVRALLPLLQAQPQAAVVAVGSTFGSLGFPGFAGYSASKFGLRGLFEALAREYADSHVRFQYLAPRATRTAFNTAQVDALNQELKVGADTPEQVARALREAIERGDRRLQIGWPEKLFARLNGALPGLVDRSLKAQLPVVRRHAARVPSDLGDLR